MKLRACTGVAAAVLASCLVPPVGAAPSTGGTVIAPVAVLPTPSVDWGKWKVNCSSGGLGLVMPLVITNPTKTALSGTLTVEGATTAPIPYSVPAGTPDSPATGSFYLKSNSGFRACTGNLPFVLRGTGNAFPQAIAASHTYRPFRVFHNAGDQDFRSNAIWVSTFNGTGAVSGNDCGGPIKFAMGLQNSMVTKLLMTATLTYAGKQRTLENKSIVKGSNLLEFDMGSTLDCTALSSATYSISGTVSEGIVTKTVNVSGTAEIRSVHLQ